jgi:hypothetical protein
MSDDLLLIPEIAEEQVPARRLEGAAVWSRADSGREQVLLEFQIYAASSIN